MNHAMASCLWIPGFLMYTENKAFPCHSRKYCSTSGAIPSMLNWLEVNGWMLQESHTPGPNPESRLSPHFLSSWLFYIACCHCWCLTSSDHLPTHPDISSGDCCLQSPALFTPVLLGWGRSLWRGHPAIECSGAASPLIQTRQ